MSKEHPMILYVGTEHDTLCAAAEARGWYVSAPGELMEALGLFVVDMPDIVVIDARVAYAADAYLHLDSVKSGTPILTIGEVVGADDMPMLDTDSSAAEVLDAVQVVLVGDTELLTA